MPSVHASRHDVVQNLFVVGTISKSAQEDAPNDIRADSTAY